MTPPRRVDRATAVAAVLVALALVVPIAGAFRQPGAPMEEGKLLVAAELVLDGEVPHRDFEHFYGPADVWAVAAGFAVLGHSVAAERAVGVAYVVLLVGCVFVLARRVGRVPAALAAVFAGYVLLPFGVHAYSWTAAVGLLLLAVVLVLRATEPDRAGRSLSLALAAGASGGLALLYRADLAVAVALVAAAMWSRLTPAQRLRGLLGGLATAVVPYLVHVATAGIGAAWRGMVTDTLFRLRDGRALPMPPPGGALTAWLDLAAPEPSKSRLLPDPARVTQLRAFFWMTVLAIVATAAVAIWAALRRRSERDTAWLLCIGAVLVAMAPQMLQRADATHVRFVACVALPLAPIVVARAIAMVDRRMPQSAAAAELVVLTTVALVLAVPYYTARLAGTVVQRGIGRVDTARVGIDGRTFPVIDPLAPDATALLARLDAIGPPAGRLFVGPVDLRLANYSDAFLYFVLGERYRPASFFLESNPGIANATGSTLAADIARADVLVLSTEYDNWDEPNASRDPGPDAPVRAVADGFCTVAEIGRYRILLRAGSVLCANGAT